MQISNKKIAYIKNAYLLKLVAFVALITLSIGAYANDSNYEPLVVEGRTWSYLIPDVDNRVAPQYYHYTICGTQDNMGSKNQTFHKCYKYYGCDFNIDELEPIAYLHETSQKVYIIYNTNHPELSELNLPTTQKLLYDFNANDDYFVRYIEINGKERLCIEPKNGLYSDYEYIEGIGSSGTMGDLISIHNINSELYAPSIWSDQRVFNYITDADGTITYKSSLAEKYKYGTEDPCFTGEGAYEYAPFVSDGKEWVVDGVMYGSDDSFTKFRVINKISDVVVTDNGITGTLRGKSWQTETESEPQEWSDGVKIIQNGDKVYIGERLVFDMGLQVGDQFIWSEEQTWDNLTVTAVNYCKYAGITRKCIYLTCTEDPRFTDVWVEGIGSLKYGIENKPLVKSGATEELVSCTENGIEIFNNNEEPAEYEYTPLVQEGKVWNYFESFGWTALENDYARIAMSGQEEINGKMYVKCWFYYGHCEFSEENAMLLCYMREEDKRVYMLPATETIISIFFGGYEPYTSDSGELQEYLLYDFNLSAGDSYYEFTYYDDERLYHTVESVEFIEIDGKLRKMYVLSNSHKVIEGIGIIGDFSGYVCSPHPILPSCAYSTPELSHIGTLEGETTYVHFGGDPCLISEDEYQYEYVPVVREDVVWGYYFSTSVATNGKTTYIRFDGDETINGKVYKKCYRSDDCSFSDDNTELLGYMREEDKRVYAIVTDGDNLPEESLRYDFNLKAGDSFTRASGEEIKISRVNYVVVNGKLRKCFYYNQDTYDSGMAYAEGIGQWLYGDMITTDGTYQFVMEKNIKTGEVFDHSNKITTLNPCDKLSVGKIAQNELIITQAKDVAIISGASGKIAAAIFTFDGLKLVEATGDGGVDLSTAELPIGIYVVRAVNDNGDRLTQKIVVK